jgi:ABC-type transport system involved in multi-copper enzyme maturation permease subunit
MNTLKEVPDRLAATLFFSLHCAFSLFVISGAFLVFVNRAWVWIHVPAVLWTFAANVANWTCPLTTWEERSRHYTDSDRPSGFIRHYLGPLLTDIAPRRLEIIIGVSILAWNALLYLGPLHAVTFGRLTGNKG